MKLPFINKKKRESSRFQVAFATDVGLKRTNNEDDGLVISGDKSPGSSEALMIVADGMGGHESGEVASAMAVESIQRHFATRSEEATLPTSGYAELLAQTLRIANSEIYQAGIDNRKGIMGTTCTAAVKTGDELHIVHVGDSRAYVLRDNKLQQLTNDDSWVSEQVRAGFLTPQEARVHPKRNIVTQALGIGPNVDVETITVMIRKGDQFLICSDGLHGLVTDEEIEDVMQKYEITKSRDILIEKAKDMGGNDNITVALGFVKS